MTLAAAAFIAALSPLITRGVMTFAMLARMEIATNAKHSGGGFFSTQTEIWLCFGAHFHARKFRLTERKRSSALEERSFVHPRTKCSEFKT